MIKGPAEITICVIDTLFIPSSDNAQCPFMGSQATCDDFLAAWWVCGPGYSFNDYLTWAYKCQKGAWGTTNVKKDEWKNGLNQWILKE